MRRKIGPDVYVEYPNAISGVGTRLWVDGIEVKGLKSLSVKNIIAAPDSAMECEITMSFFGVAECSIDAVSAEKEMNREDRTPPAK